MSKELYATHDYYDILKHSLPCAHFEIEILQYIYSQYTHSMLNIL